MQYDKWCVDMMWDMMRWKPPYQREKNVKHPAIKDKAQQNIKKDTRRGKENDLFLM